MQRFYIKAQTINGIFSRNVYREEMSVIIYRKKNIALNIISNIS